MMKRSIAALAIVLGVMSVVSAAPASASDRDCSDFATQKAAQLFFLRHGGPRSDPHRLDADHDGIACESLPCPCYRKRRLPRLALGEGEAESVAPDAIVTSRAAAQVGRYWQL